jgi:hypothetical protein
MHVQRIRTVVAGVIVVVAVACLAQPAAAAPTPRTLRPSSTPRSGPATSSGLTPLRYGYYESLGADGTVTYATGTASNQAPGPDNALTGTLPPTPRLPNGVTVSIQLPVGQSITAGHFYGSGYTGLVSMSSTIGCASNGAFQTAVAQVDQVATDGSGDISAFAVQVTCQLPGTDVPYAYAALAVDVTPTTPHQGYYSYQSDGQISAFGNDNYLVYLGDLSASTLNQPIVGMATTPDGGGYWLVARDGGVFAYGDAGFFGSAGDIHLNQPIVGMATTADGRGYWLVASDGGVFAYGDATYQGSMGGTRLNRPIVGMAAHPGGGYWLVASDGGIFSFGDATFHGSAGNLRLNKPVVGMAPTPSGLGYWLVATDGGIFSYGDATFHGSAGNLPLTEPIVGMQPTPDGTGYWLVARDGGIFAFKAPFYGSLGGQGLDDIVGLTS